MGEKLVVVALYVTPSPLFPAPTEDALRTMIECALRYGLWPKIKVDAVTIAIEGEDKSEG